MVSPVFGAVLAGIIIAIGLLITRIYIWFQQELKELY